MAKLIITEKESVAQSLAKALKINKETESYYKGNDYIISWASGHLIELAEPEDYEKKYKYWSLKNLPIIPDTFKLKSKKNKQLDILIQLLNEKEVEEIINACDAGREGELIFRYIYEYSKSKKPVRRLWLNALTQEAILDAFNNLKPQNEYEALYQAAQTRAESDWLVGINCSRAFTVKHGLLLSVGRVQTPTLYLIVKRDLEISSFLPVKFFQILADFESDKGTYRGKWKGKEDRVYELVKAEKIKNKVSGKVGIVKSYSERVEKVSPPLLFDLGSLQREANQKFGYPASKTLQIAQNLYEKRKLITYPRTDSKYLPLSYLPETKSVLKTLNNFTYKKWVNELLKKKLPTPTRIFNDAKVTDHHAIIPTSINPEEIKLTTEESKIYELIAKRFIAAFLPPDVYKKVNIETVVENEHFYTSDRELTVSGWSSLYGREAKSTSQMELAKGDVVRTKEVIIEEGTTTPPPRYTDGTLISAMETAGKLVEEDELKEALKEKGLGTPATRAQIIEKLIKVQYVEREGQNLIATQKGLEFITLFENQNQELISPEMTAEWEYRLKLIEKSLDKREKFMNDIKNFVISIVDKVKSSERSTSLKATVNRLAGICPICGKEVRENRKAFACVGYKEGCPTTIWKKSYGRNINLQEAQNLLLSRKIGPLWFKSKTKKPYSAYLALTNEGVSLEFTQRTSTEGTPNNKPTRNNKGQNPDVTETIEEKFLTENNNHNIGSGVKKPKIVTKQDPMKKGKGSIKEEVDKKTRSKKKS